MLELFAIPKLGVAMMAQVENVIGVYLAGFLAVLGVACIIFLVRIRRPVEFKNLPSPPQTSWIFGHILETTGSFAKWRTKGNFPDPYLTWRNDLGSVLYVREIMNHALVVMDPKAIQHILVSNTNNYPRFPKMSEYFKDASFGVGLLSSHGPEHDQFRKILNPLFSAHSIKTFIGLFESQARRCCDDVLAKASKTNTALNMLQVFQRLTLSVIGLAAFGYTFEEDGIGYKAYNDFQIELNPYLVMLLLSSPEFANRLPIPALQRRRKAHLQLKQVMQDVIDQKLSEQSKNIDKPKDLLDLILPHSSNQEALVHTMTMMTGGHETTSTTLAWAFLALSERPDIVAQLREENASVVAKHGSLSTWEAVAELTYTLAVVHETLRLNSIVFLISRMSKEADTVPLMDGTTISIPPNTKVSLFVSAMNHSSEYWHEPESFVPERFIKGTAAWKEDAKLRQQFNQKMYFFPFSNGSKNCIGQRFALAELQVVISTLVSRFDFVASEDTGKRHKFNGIVVHPAKLNMFVKEVGQAQAA